MTSDEEAEGGGQQGGGGLTGPPRDEGGEEEKEEEEGKGLTHQSLSAGSSKGDGQLLEHAAGGPRGGGQTGDEGRDGMPWSGSITRA